MNLININIININFSHALNATGKNKEPYTVLCTMNTRSVKTNLRHYWIISVNLVNIFALTKT